MNFKEYQGGVLRTANQRMTMERQRLNAALGLGEAGEVQNIVKKEVFHGHPEEPSLIAKELGDTLYYLTWMATLYGYTLEEIAIQNQEKLRARYPEGFSSERSLNRSEA